MFQNLKTSGFLVGVEAYSKKYTVDSVSTANLVIIFKDDIEKFNTNCGSHGIGTLCQNNQLSSAQTTELFDAIDVGIVPRSRFASIIGYILANEMELTMIQAKSSLSGQVFVTDHYEGDTREPSYFDNFIDVLITQVKKESGRGLGKSGDCGCSDKNECTLGTHACPVNSDCTDISPGYSCTCKTGYEHDLSQTTLVCVDVNECTTNTHDCDSNAECENNDGLFDMCKW